MTTMEEKEIVIYKDFYNIRNIRLKQEGDPTDPKHSNQRANRAQDIESYIPDIARPDIKDLLDRHLTKVWKCRKCGIIGMTFMSCQEIPDLLDLDGRKIYFTTYKNERNSISKVGACANHQDPAPKGKRAGRAQMNGSPKIRKMNKDDYNNSFQDLPQSSPNGTPHGSDDERSLTLSTRGNNKTVKIEDKARAPPIESTSFQHMVINMVNIPDPYKPFEFSEIKQNTKISVSTTPSDSYHPSFANAASSDWAQSVLPRGIEPLGDCTVPDITGNPFFDDKLVPRSVIEQKFGKKVKTEDTLKKMEEMNITSIRGSCSSISN